MGEHVAQRDLAGDPGIVHLEAGIVADDRVVPVDDAIPDQRRHHRRGDRLRQGGELKDRVRIDRVGLALRAHAKPFEIDDLVLVDDGDRHAGDAGALPRRFGELLQLRQGGFDPLPRHRRGLLRENGARHQGGRSRRSQHRPA